MKANKSNGLGLVLAIILAAPMGVGVAGAMMIISDLVSDLPIASQLIGQSVCRKEPTCVKTFNDGIKAAMILLGLLGSTGLFILLVRPLLAHRESEQKNLEGQ